MTGSARPDEFLHSLGAGELEPQRTLRRRDVERESQKRTAESLARHELHDPIVLRRREPKRKSIGELGDLLDSLGGEPANECMMRQTLGHSSTGMVERVYSHLGTIRHRSEVIEYRVEQHRKVLAKRLKALGWK